MAHNARVSKNVGPGRWGLRHGGPLKSSRYRRLGQAATTIIVKAKIAQGAYPRPFGFVAQNAHPALHPGKSAT
eukprot:9491655-Pyramimonas_sp.AAC.1